MERYDGIARNNELIFETQFGHAKAFRDALPSGDRAALDEVLEYIREKPVPDGEKITSVLMAPVVIYFYNDGVYKVSYSLSYYPAEQRFHTSVHALAFADPLDGP